VKELVGKDNIVPFLKSVQEYLRSLEPDTFMDPGVRFGIGEWSITLVSLDGDEGTAIFQLLQTRQDLIMPIVLSRGWWGFYKSLTPLADWLHTRNYLLMISGNTFWTRLATRLLGVLSK